MVDHIQYQLQHCEQINIGIDCIVHMITYLYIYIKIVQLELRLFIYFRLFF